MKLPALPVLSAALLLAALPLVNHFAAAGDAAGETRESEAGGGESDPNEPPPVATSPLAAIMLRCGLGPRELATAGVTDEEISGLIVAFRTAHDTYGDDLAAADAAFASERAEVDRLVRLIRARKGSPQDVAANVSACQSARSSCTSAEAARDQALDDLFDATTVGLSQAEIATLQAIRGNSEWKFPPPYLVVSRSEEDWVQLRDCLSNEVKGPEIGDGVDPACTSFLASVRADEDVAAALASFAANRAAVGAAWNLALSE